ncbi:MAG: YjbH domain-containing protein [Pelosinus sp.]|nr:YjbH domain-containing protein [Pelosinus sp.]
MKKIIGLSAICLTFLTAVATAAPALNGSTGLINTPSADVLREGQISLGYYHLKDGGVGNVAFHVAGNLEVGAAGFRYDGQANKTYVNAKLALAPETVLTPGLALGVMDAANQQERSFYAVASKALPLGLRLHVGTGSGQFGGVFAGIEKTINPVSVLTGNNAFPATTFIAEYDGKNMNYGARLSIVPGLKVDAGWRSNKSTYFGLSFTN